MAEFYSGQARYKQLAAAKDGKYRMLAKTKENRETERKRQIEKLKSLQAVVDKLSTDFPATQEYLQTVSVTLNARLTTNEDTAVQQQQKVVDVA